MSRALHLCILSSAILSFSLVLASSPATGQSEASVSGRVTYVDGRPAPLKPVDFANIEALDKGDVVRTGSDGSYVIKGLADGTYLIGAFDADRVPADANPAIEELPLPKDASSPTRLVGRRVVIAGGKSVDNIDFVITDIGPETVEGPEAGPDGVQLPDAGAPEDEGSTPVALLAGLSALLAASAAGAGLLVLRGRR